MGPCSYTNIYNYSNINMNNEIFAVNLHHSFQNSIFKFMLYPCFLISHIILICVDEITMFHRFSSWKKFRVQFEVIARMKLKIKRSRFRL